jgi:hypothetical protein
MGSSDESIGELGKFNFRRIALDPDQITRVESRSYGITHDVVVSWKEPNAETIIVPCETIEEAIKLQDLILQVIHDAKFNRRQLYR